MGAAQGPTGQSRREENKSTAATTGISTSPALASDTTGGVLRPGTGLSPLGSGTGLLWTTWTGGRLPVPEAGPLVDEK